MSKMVSAELCGYWYDPLEKIWWIYRDGDPKEYGFICPHCQKRYGEKQNYIMVERCSDCPPYFPRSEISWDLTRSEKKYLKKIGYFINKPRGGKKKKEITNGPVSLEEKRV